MLIMQNTEPPGGGNMGNRNKLWKL